MKMIWLLSMSVIMLFSCNENSIEPVVQKEEFSLKSLQLIEQSNDFTWKMFKAVNQGADEGANVVISPISITQAFGMAINGSTGDNLDEMLGVFGFNNTDGMNEAYKNIRGALSTADPKVTVGIANSAWYKDGFEIKQPFFDALKQNYDATVAGLDFDDNAGSLKTMNDWVKNKTKGKIPSIVENISEDHILFLINAVYFNGQWASRFDKGKTVNAPFYLSDGTSVQAKMMHQKENFVVFNEGSTRGIHMFYGDSSFVMSVLLPGEAKSADALIDEMSPEIWNRIRSYNHSGEVNLYLPRFKTECSYDLIPSLQAVGMQRAFYDIQGFHNIADAPIIISDVKHKTFIEVDEKGTEAAAATSIGIEVTSMPVVTEFRVDQPFVFIISERTSGVVLFAGKIENPLKEN
jgi:serpin B